ncbi:MAG: GGDEF domain-containing protein [Hyphomicrobiales bacterium]
MSELPSTANAESGQGQAIIAFALEASGSAAYSWSITSDTLTWSGSAAGLLGRPPEAFATGKQFASLLDSENLTTRYDTIINASSRDAGEGVPYQIEYLLKADADAGLPPMWIEDTGRWFADATGQPALATGVIRIITERHNRDQVLSALSHTDALTGLMNRNRLEGALAQMLAETVERKASAAFAVVAIRNIDIVNDAYGFAVADEVIAAMSERLRGVMRMGDGIGRYAGSKFGILLNNCTADDLPVALERFLEVARGNVIETSSGPVWALLRLVP